MTSFLKRLSSMEWIAISLMTIHGIFSTAMIGVVNHTISYFRDYAPYDGIPIFYPTAGKNGTTKWNQNSYELIPEDFSLGPTRKLFDFGFIGLVGSIAIIALMLFRTNLRDDKIKITRKFGIPVANILIAAVFFLFGYILVTTITLWQEHANSSLLDPSLTPNNAYIQYPASKGQFDPESWNCQLAFYEGDESGIGYGKVGSPKSEQQQLCNEEMAIRFATIPLTLLAGIVAGYIFLMRRKTGFSEEQTKAMQDF